MNWYQKLIAKFVGPSLVSQVIRGAMKLVSGYLLAYGVQSSTVSNLTDGLIEVGVAVLLYMTSHKASEKAMEKALDATPPNQPVIVTKGK